MCDFKQREYSCGHIRWLATRLCDEYILTRRRSCPKNVMEFEEKPDICGECKPKLLSQAPWMRSFMNGLKLHSC